mgnify:CR=1 FL=1
MKKIALLLVVCMVATMFAGCAGTPVVYECTCPTETVEAVPEAPAATEAPAVEGALKTGLAVVANIGDSRLYLLGDGIKQLSRDHSFVQEMVRLGGLKAEEAKNHPDNNNNPNPACEIFHATKYRRVFFIFFISYP